jgi:ribose/xylose/arabinose/galactoside ABC-type transport system permease subunit
LTKDNLLNVVRQVAISGVMSLGFTIIMASGCMDLSVGNMLSMIGVIVAILAKIDGMPLAVACLAGIVVGVVCGVINATISTVFNLAPFIVTLAMGNVFEGATYLIAGGKPISGLPDTLIHIGQGYILGIPIPVLILFAVAIIMWLFLSQTKTGRHILAIGGNVNAARVCGVNVSRTKLIAYICMGISVALGAIIMDGRVASAQVAAGKGMEMDALAAVVIGGTPLGGGYGNMIGTLIGCLIVGVMNNGLNLLHVSSYWQMVAKGAIILFAIILDSISSRVANRRMKESAK